MSSECGLVRLDKAAGGFEVGRSIDTQRNGVNAYNCDPHAVLKRAHLFVFASSCENMPNTLVEAMASGLPIACSDRGPMPEILRDGGTYFDPENEVTIVVPDGEREVGRRPKADVAAAILDEVERLRTRAEEPTTVEPE